MNNPSAQERFAGILLHPTSLPGRSGIGDMGAPAREFIDYLARSRQTLWQICPLGPTGYGDSPYASLSAFAGNPLLISLEQLVEDGLLDQAAVDALPIFPEPRVDYGAVIPAKTAVLRQVADAFDRRASGDLKSEYAAFCERSTHWLDDFALFITLKDAHGGAQWTDWAPAPARRDGPALDRVRAERADDIECHRIIQFLFFRQWGAVRRYANDHGVRIIGDVPIFLAHDSADVWANRDLFFMDEAGQPTVVSGVPPDFFSKTGQLWGNPLYRWRRMARDGYQWWINRIRACLDMVDLVRLDHFRGFEAYYEVPATEKTAVNGRWRRGPGRDLFDAFRRELGELPLIAEDLGLITPKIHQLRKELGLPGMKVLQFAFGDDPFNLYLPHNVGRDFVVYTGTHDNDTTVGWYRSLAPHEADHVRRYLWCDGSNIHLDMMRAALMSHAAMAVFPLQDVLGLGSESRMNAPGQPGGNWQWRLTPGQLGQEVVESLGYMTELYGRATPPAQETEPMDPRHDPDLAGEPADEG